MRDSRKRKCSFKKHLATICTFLLTHIKQLEFCFVVRVLILQKHLSFSSSGYVLFVFLGKNEARSVCRWTPFSMEKGFYFQNEYSFFLDSCRLRDDNKKLTKKYCDLICVFFV